MNKILLLAPEKCIGCRTCEMVCSLSHEGRCSPSESRINVIKYEETGVNIPMMCANCQDPVCERVCPTRAISKKGSIVIVNYEKCIGCRMCVIACPIGGVAFHPEKKKIIKCDLCDGNPLCAKFCPQEALQYISLDRAGIKKRREQVRNLSAFLNNLQGE